MHSSKKSKTNDQLEHPLLKWKTQKEWNDCIRLSLEFRTEILLREKNREKEEDLSQ